MNATTTQTATRSDSNPPSILPAPVKYMLSALILIVGVGSMVGLSMLKKKPANKKQKTIVMHVDTFSAEPYEGDIGIDVNGVVVPHKEIRISTEVAGKIELKTDKCQSGQIVRKGELLILIEKLDYEYDLVQAKADYQQAEKSYEELAKEMDGARTNIQLAEKEFELQKSEYQRRLDLGTGVLSQSELEQSRRNLLMAEKAKENADNMLLMLDQRVIRLENAKLLAQAKVDKAKLNLQRCEIRAPIDGVVVRDLAEKDDFLQRGTQILTLEDTSAVEIQCSLRPDQIQWLWENSSNPANRMSENPYQLPPSEVEIQSNFGEKNDKIKWTGRLTSFDGIGLDEKTKMVPCRIVVDEPVVMTEWGKRALIRGMFVSVNIKIQASQMSAHGQKFVKFPAVAVQPGNYVWTVDSENKLNRYQVKIADRFKTDDPKSMFEKFVVLRQIKGGIQLGEKIVLTPMAQAEPGTTVVPETTLGNNLKAEN